MIEAYMQDGGLSKGIGPRAAPFKRTPDRGPGAHLLKRMKDRRFSETDLCLMFEDASGYHENYERGQYVVQTRYGERPWEVIVEPVPEEGVVVVVTAYPSEAEG